MDTGYNGEIKDARMPVSITSAESDVKSFTLADETPKVAHTRPVGFSFLGNEYTTCSWTDFIVALAKLARQGEHGDLLDEVGASDINFTEKLCIASTPNGMIQLRQIDDALWIETNFSAKQMVDFAKWLTWWCDIEPSSVVISYGSEAHASSIAYKTKTNLCGEPRTNSNPSNDNLDVNAVRTPILNRLREFLLTHYPDGLSLSPTGLELLKGQVPQECVGVVNAGYLKKVLFRCGDDCWLLPEMVAAASAQDNLRSKIIELVGRYSSYALSNLLKEFAADLRHVTSELKDFAAYLCFCVLPSDMEIVGRGEEMQCVFRGQFLETSFREKTAGMIRGILEEAGDAMTEEELLSSLPYLNSVILRRICREGLPKAIFFQVDGVAYWKLLENYWLPEDFGEQLSLIVPRLEKINAVATLPQIQQELQDVYGISFRDDYAMAEDEVFRQVIAASWQGPAYVWKKGTIFAADGAGKTASQPSAPTVMDAFLQDHHGVFHEDDFVKYAKNTWNIRAGHAILTSTRLLPNCIRLSERQWIAPKDFFVQDIFSEEEWQRIEQRLLSYLGRNPFLPVGELPQAFYDDLKPLKIQDATYYWNAYLLSSVAQFHLNKLRIVNTTVAPYTSTGLLLPLEAEIKTNDGEEVLKYCLQYWPRYNGVTYTVEDAFDYLKKQKIRLVKKKVLLLLLDNWLKEHTYV